MSHRDSCNLEFSCGRIRIGSLEESMDGNQLETEAK